MLLCKYKVQIKTSYTQFKKYLSKMNNEDRLSKRG